jgi:hypothetical protein
VTLPSAGLPPAAPGPGPEPDVVAAAVQACPLVAGLHSGAFGEVASYLPGRRVRGVRVTVDVVEIHVVGRYPATMTQIAEQVRAVVSPLAGALPVDVVIEDLALPGEVVEPEAIAADPSSVAAATPVAPPVPPHTPGGVARPGTEPLPAAPAPGPDPKDLR